MNLELPIAVLTHNPKGKWGDVRQLIEDQGYYKNWGKNLNLQNGQTVLIYISSNIRKIQYIMEVVDIHQKGIDLKLLNKLSEDKQTLLSYDKLRENGLKKGTINYILNNNKSLYKYVMSILEKKEKPIKIEKNIFSQNIILYGPPGVGKTHNINKLISLVEAGNSTIGIFQTIEQNGKSEYISIDDIKERVKFLTFHQSFGYEDFIEGFRPNEEGNIHLESGIFKRICEDAETDKAHNYYLIIDEINRGNISKIFGELITLIEEDKRDKLEVTLPYSKEPFKVPSNLYIIGTMNSTDKSIALIDIALRRRFTFLKMKPNAELIDDAEAKEIFVLLNAYISEKLGEEYQIGHSYFMGKDIDLDFVLEYKIKPFLEEYFYGDIQGLEEVEKIIGEI